MRGGARLFFAEKRRTRFTAEGKCGRIREKDARSGAAGKRHVTEHYSTERHTEKTDGGKTPGTGIKEKRACGMYAAAAAAAAGTAGFCAALILTGGFPEKSAETPYIGHGQNAEENACAFGSRCAAYAAENAGKSPYAEKEAGGGEESGTGFSVAGDAFLVPYSQEYVSCGAGGRGFAAAEFCSLRTGVLYILCTDFGGAKAGNVIKNTVTGFVREDGATADAERLGELREKYGYGNGTGTGNTADTAGTADTASGAPDGDRMSP